MASINRGDNTGAFGNEFLRIYLNNPNHLAITKAIFHINSELEKEYYNPTFPLKVNFTGEETEMLSQVNTCKLALWDEQGRRRTADGKFTFFVRENCIKSPDTPIEAQSNEEENAVYFNLDEPEFACEFVINATPSKMSELEQDIDLFTLDDVHEGRNITIDRTTDSITINAEVASSVSYKDLTDLPKINGETLVEEIYIETPVNADWRATSGRAEILNKPSFSSVAYTGKYTDLFNQPFIPSKTSELTNDAGFVDSEGMGNYYTKTQVDDRIRIAVDLDPVYERIAEVENKETSDMVDVTQSLATKVDVSTFDDKVAVLTAKDKSQDTKISNAQSSIRNINSTIETLATKEELNTVDEKIEGLVTQDELTDAITPLATVSELNTGLDRKVNKTELYNGKLSILANNNLKGEFTANSKDNVSINLAIPNKTTDLVNDAGFVTAEEVGTYVTQEELTEKLNDKVNLKELGSATITLKVNNEQVGTFNSNAKNAKSINFTVPTKLSDVEQDIDYLVEDDLSGIKTRLTNDETTIDAYANRFNTIEDNMDLKLDRKAGFSLVANSEIERLKTVDNYNDTEVKVRLTTVETKVNTFDTDISNKVDKVAGKGLSTNDFTTAEKDQLAVNTGKITTMQSDVEDMKTTSTQVVNRMETVEETTRVTKSLIDDEIDARQEQDNILQQQIEALQAKSKVVDIVGTLAELDTYDTSKLTKDDVICVLKDSSRENTVTYYRWNGERFQFIGSEGNGYTKSEANSLFAKSSLMINGHKLDKNIELLPSDVGALPSTTVIGNGTLTFQINGVQKEIFKANSTENATFNVLVPTDTNDLNNGAGFVSKSDLTNNYLGTLPKDTLIQDEIEVLQTAVSTLSGNLPKVALSGSYNDLKDKPFIPTNTSEMTNDAGFVKSSQASKSLETILSETMVGFAKAEDIPTAVSQLENDRGYITNPALGKGDCTFYLNNSSLGSFNANSKEDVSITIPVETSVNTSTNPVQSKAVKTYADNLNSTAVHKTGDETISGTKTIANLVSTTQANTDNSTKVATTAFVKNQGYAVDTAMVHLAGTETITGNKTFSGTVTLNTATGKTQANNDNSTKLATTAFVHNQNYATDSTVVHKTGDETINGDKTFAETTTFNGITNLGAYAHVNTPDGKTNDSVVNVEYLLAQLKVRDDLITALTARVKALEEA